MIRFHQMREERGIALVAAIILGAVVFLLGVAALTVAVNTNQTTADDRSRAQGVHAAEAGVNRVIEQFSRNFATAGDCSGGLIDGNLTAAGADIAGYMVDVEPTPSDPACSSNQRLLRAWGTVGSTVRTLEVTVEVFPITGFRFALFAGSGAGNGEIYSQPNMTVTGNVYADIFLSAQPNYDVTGETVTPGDLVTKPGAVFNGPIKAGGSVTLQNGAIVQGDVLAATGSLTLGNNSEVHGNAQYATTLTNGGTITGNVISPPDDPAPAAIPLPTFDQDDPNLPSPKGDATHTFTSVAAANAFFRTTTSVSGTYQVELGLTENSNATLELTKALNVTGPTTIVARQNARGAPKIDFARNWTATGGPHQLVIVSMSANTNDAIEFKAPGTTLSNDLCSLFYTPGQILISNGIDIFGALYGSGIRSLPNSKVTHCPDLVDNPPAGFEFPFGAATEFEVRTILWREVAPAPTPSPTP